MKSLRFALIALAVGLQGFSQTQIKPKLIVGLVVDQMRIDYIYRYWDKFGDDGFKKLINDGYFCRNAHFNYIPTYTGPGHASIFTGTTPMTHGIIGNNWYDRISEKEVYCVEDNNVQTVGTEGNVGQRSPAKLLTPTLGDAVRLSNNFNGKSIGISLKDRSAILPAGSSANAAYWFDSKSGRMITSTYYMNELPKWVTHFNNQKLAEKLCEGGWSTLLDIRMYTESIRDNNNYENPMGTKNEPTFPYDLKTAIKNNGLGVIANTPYGNTLLRMFAEEVLLKEELGQGDNTDFLSISFSSTDLVGHAYGPQSIEVEDTYLRLDLELAKLINELDLRVGEGQYMLFMTADHGAAQVPQYAKDHNISGGLFDDELFQKTLNEALSKEFNSSILVSRYINQHIYLNHDEMVKINISEHDLVDFVKEYALAFDGVGNALSKKELQHPLPPDQFSILSANGWNPQRSGDIVIQYLPGWEEWTSKGTSHGSSYAYDTHVPLVFYGFGIPKGESIKEVNITQIAPTVSLLARISFPFASEHKPIEWE